MLDSNDAIPGHPAPTGRKPSTAAPPLANIVAPFTKTAGYYARSWGAYLDGDKGELPVARPTLSLATHALRDEIVLVGLRLRRPLSDTTVYDRINSEVVKAIDFYGKRGWLARPEGFFAQPPRADRREDPQLRPGATAGTSGCRSTAVTRRTRRNRDVSAG